MSDEETTEQKVADTAASIALPLLKRALPDVEEATIAKVLLALGELLLDLGKGLTPT